MYFSMYYGQRKGIQIHIRLNIYVHTAPPPQTKQNQNKNPSHSLIKSTKKYIILVTDFKNRL